MTRRDNAKRDMLATTTKSIQSYFMIFKLSKLSVYNLGYSNNKNKSYACEIIVRYKLISLNKFIYVIYSYWSIGKYFQIMRGKVDLALFLTRLIFHKVV
jgi:hypothetical protein